MSRQLLHSEKFVCVSFEAQCDDFIYIGRKTFKSRFVFVRRPFVNQIARILKINGMKIELLKPIHTQNGAIFTMNIETEASRIDSADKNLIAQAIKKCYLLHSMPEIIHFTVTQLSAIETRESNTEEKMMAEIAMHD